MSLKSTRVSVLSNDFGPPTPTPDFVKRIFHKIDEKWNKNIKATYLNAHVMWHVVRLILSFLSYLILSLALLNKSIDRQKKKHIKKCMVSVDCVPIFIVLNLLCCSFFMLLLIYHFFLFSVDYFFWWHFLPLTLSTPHLYLPGWRYLNFFNCI